MLLWPFLTWTAILVETTHAVCSLESGDWGHELHTAYFVINVKLVFYKFYDLIQQREMRNILFYKFYLIQQIKCAIY